MTATEALIDMLTEARDFIDRYSDVNDGSYGVPEPNDAMVMVHEINATLEQVASPASSSSVVQGDASGMERDVQGLVRPDAMAGRRWRHKERGTTYTSLGFGKAQCSPPGLLDDENVVIYQGDDGSLWARRHAEFSDGRFEEIASDLTPAPVSRPAGEGEREAVARIIDPAAFLFAPDELPKDSRAQYEAFNKADRIMALLRPAASDAGRAERLRVLLDNLVIAQGLSKEIRQQATDEARSYLYDLRRDALQPGGER